MGNGKNKEIQGYEAWLAADLPGDKVVAAAYWHDGEHWLFDPWASNRGAGNIHNHCHTHWARSILHNLRNGKIESPAIFDWRGKTVYIVGRGESLKENVEALNRRPDESIAIFLNHAFKEEGIEFRQQDFVCCMDSHVINTISAGDAQGKNLIACVTVCPEILAYPWSAIYGFTLWPEAPLNDLMREEFPDLPAINECLGIAVSAMHLAAANGAARIVLVGQDCTDANGKKTVELPNGAVRADEYYIQLAQALGLMAYFAYRRTECEIVNTSRNRLVGFNVINPRLGFMPWVKFNSLDAVVSGAGGTNG